MAFPFRYQLTQKTTLGLEVVHCNRNYIINTKINCDFKILKHLALKSKINNSFIQNLIFCCFYVYCICVCLILYNVRPCFPILHYFSFETNFHTRKEVTGIWCLFAWSFECLSRSEITRRNYFSKINDETEIKSSACDTTSR